MDIRELKAEHIKEFIKDPEKRPYVIISAAIVFFLLVVLFAAAPGVRSFLDMSSRQREMDERNILAEEDISRLDEVAVKLGELKKEYSNYASNIPGRKEIGEFLESLAVTAGESDVILLSVTPLEQRKVDTSQEIDTYSDMMVVISAKGGYHQINRFVDFLERGRGFSTLRDIRIQHDPRNPTRHDVDIVLRIYVKTGDEQNGGK
jgi:Tfp pilus assembly protein PilO